MSFSDKDLAIVRDLARQVMEIAALPVQEEKRALWRALNRLRPRRPMVWLNELPWNEMGCDELACHAENDVARRVEGQLRSILYHWRHLRVDMVVDGVYFTPLVYRDTGYAVEAKTVPGTGDFGFGARDYVPIMKTAADIERIQMPKITADPEASERHFQQVSELLGGVMPVQKRGVVHMWFAPWDQLIQWYGITELMTDMVDRPAFVHKAISRMVDAMMARLDQLEKLGLLSMSDGNHRVGSGGLGITDQLQAPANGAPVRPLSQWGTATGQIFSEVSPAMHDEFCLQHELRWLRRFGLNCYGCCEPLHTKMGILRQVPRLRRVSMSRWIKLDDAVKVVGNDYIFSYKPNPAIFAWDTWEPEKARDEIRRVLAATKGCSVEFIMKDVSTCRSQPQRIWDWCKLALEEVQR